MLDDRVHVQVGALAGPRAGRLDDLHLALEDDPALAAELLTQAALQPTRRLGLRDRLETAVAPVPEVVRPRRVRGELVLDHVECVDDGLEQLVAACHVALRAGGRERDHRLRVRGAPTPPPASAPHPPPTPAPATRARAAHAAVARARPGPRRCRRRVGAPAASCASRRRRGRSSPPDPSQTLVRQTGPP
jgi:hypothetical protein